MFCCLSLNWTAFRMYSRLCFSLLGKSGFISAGSHQGQFAALLTEFGMCLALNGATLVAFSGKTHCCWSVQLSVRTHCSVFTHHSSGVFQKSLKNKWVAAFALLNFVVICPSITDCWFERSHLSPQGQYLDATSAESHPQMHLNHMKWVGFSLSHPTAGKLLRPQHTECCRSSSSCPAKLTHSNIAMPHSFPSHQHFYSFYFFF